MGALTPLGATLHETIRALVTWTEQHQTHGHLVRRHHDGRRARVRGTAHVDADFRLLAGAVNLARLAALGLRGIAQGWAVAA